MRNLFVASLVASASVVAGASVAAAQPGTAPPGAAPPGFTPPAAIAPPAAPRNPFPEHVFVAAGLLLGDDVFINAALVLEAGIRIPGTPLWLYGNGARGVTGDVEGGGDMWRVLGGIEVRECWRRQICAGVGAAVGHQNQVWEKAEEPTEHHDGTVVAGRLVLDIGLPAGLRIRNALEIYRYDHHEEGWEREDAWVGGGSLVTSVGFQF